MDEVTRSLFRNLSPMQRFAAMVEARRQAINATKLKLRAQGQRPEHMPPRQIAALAEGYLAKHRVELVGRALRSPFICALLSKYEQTGGLDHTRT
jgi:hypothetical protein